MPKKPRRRGAQWKMPPRQTHRPPRQWQPAPGRRRWQKGVSGAGEDERPRPVRPKSGKPNPRTLPWWDRRRQAKKPLKRYSIDKGNPDVRRRLRVRRK